MLEHFSERMRRRMKAWQQRRKYPAGGAKHMTFIMGCQRSGTTMLSEIFDLAPEVWMYGENDAEAARNFRLLPAEELRQVIAGSHAPVLIFKPICDTQRTDELLLEHPGAKAIWIYRDYRDVANSAVAKWGDHQVDLLRRITVNEQAHLKWRGERLDDEARELAHRFYRPDMPHAEGAALFWYIRNRFYFTLGLDENPRVMLQQYEDLVQHPQRCFARLCEFAGCRYDDRYVAGVRTNSVRRRDFPAINPEITQLCEEMLARFDQKYRDSLLEETACTE